MPIEIQPFEEFFRSIRETLRPADIRWDWVAVVLGVCVALGLGRALLRRWRRECAAREALAQFLQERRIGPEFVTLIQRLAQRVGLSPLLVATHIEVFERATALELAEHPPTTAGAEVIVGELQALRRALGFHRLALSSPLRTTRELRVGMHLRVAGLMATVTEVTEAAFVVVGAGMARLPGAQVGKPVRVTLAHGHDAHYTARCMLLATTPGHGRLRLILGHDEAPSRLQRRAAVRVAVRAAVELRSGAAGSAGQQGERRGTGTLLDVSVGGAALVTKVKLVVGCPLAVTFELEGRTFADLAVRVLACEAWPRATYRIRLQFLGLAESDEAALAAIVAHLSARLPE